LDQCAFGAYLECLLLEPGCMDAEPDVLLGNDMCTSDYACELDVSKSGCSICSFVPEAQLFIHELCPLMCGTCGASSRLFHNDPNFDPTTEACGFLVSPNASANRSILTAQDSDTASDTGHDSEVVLPLIVAIASALVIMALTTVMRRWKFQWISQRTLLTMHSAVACCAFMLLGQLLLGFSVTYEFGTVKGQGFHDNFWEGISSLWRSDGKGLSIVMLWFGGVWPYLKQALTVISVLPYWTPKAELKALRFLGSAGKLAFMDIGIIVLILAVTPFHVESDVGLTGEVRSELGVGAFIMVLGLILSRCVTTTLVHCWPPSGEVMTKDYMSSLSKTAATSVRVGVVCLSIGSLAMVLLGTCLPAMSLTHHLTLTVVGADPVVLLDETSEYSMWSIVEKSMALDDVSPLQVLLAVITLLLSNILGVIHAVLQVFALLMGLSLSRWTQKTKNLMVHSLQVLNEWASLDMLCIAMLVTKEEMPRVNTAFNEAVAGDLGAILKTTIDPQAGLWLCLFGSLLTFSSSVLITAVYFNTSEVSTPEVSEEKKPSDA